jgi:uncharacterized phage protein (TIGR01671 family)
LKVREYKFRGLDIEVESGVWRYGNFTKTNMGGELVCVIEDVIKGVLCYYLVKPETVGQYIGLKDKNGKEIYEGDCLGGELEGFFITYDDSRAMFALSCDGELEEVDFHEIKYSDYFSLDVVGNIYENPELAG